MNMTAELRTALGKSTTQLAAKEEALVELQVGQNPPMRIISFLTHF